MRFDVLPDNGSDYVFDGARAKTTDFYLGRNTIAARALTVSPNAVLDPAYVAKTGAVPADAWLLYLATLLWTVAYDTMYAMVDRADDLRIGVRSTAILFGRADRLMIGLLQAMTLLVLALLGSRLQLGFAYYAGLAVAAALAFYQQYLIRARDPALCFRAFLNNNWSGAAVFAGLVVQYAG